MGTMGQGARMGRGHVWLACHDKAMLQKAEKFEDDFLDVLFAELDRDVKRIVVEDWADMAHFKAHTTLPVLHIAELLDAA